MTRIRSMQELSTEERDIINHWSMFGAYAMVTKFGPGKWSACGLRSYNPPKLFKTRKEAVEFVYTVITGMRRA